MSRKKNRNRHQSLLHESFDNENQISSNTSLNNKIGSAESDAATSKDVKTGITSYLKTHWWAVALVVFLTIG